MTGEPTTAEKISKLPWSITANALNSIFAQFTFFGSSFVLFLSQLGLSKAQIGFLLSFFPYTGLIALFIAPAVARFGYKRTFVTFFGLRKLVTLFLLLTPWVLALFGFQAMLFYIGGVVLTFALCRAVAEIGYYPWVQEFVPNSVRGKYSAASNTFTTISGFMAVTVAGYVVGRSTGLNGFMLLIAVGVVFGLASVWAVSHSPGGAPLTGAEAKKYTLQDLVRVARDQDFLRYILGAGFITLAITPIASFLPLFMGEEVGLAAGQVVWLQTGALLGGLLSTYPWGWAADRYGSKPIMLSGASLRLFLPLVWLLMPRNNPLSLYLALGASVLQGLADMGWGIGSARLLFVSIVPPERKRDYMALYYALIGIIGGTSQLVGGQLVQRSANLSGQFLFFTLDPYTILFILGLILPLFSLLLLRGVRADTGVTVGQFAGLFLRGNPFLAVTSLIGYHLAQDERTAVSVTERLGQTRSGLTVDELLESLSDPRFNVRFEAIISIARTRPDPRLTEALVNILNGSELALSVIAAWALGRIGDPGAVEPLRAALHSEYRSIQAHSVQALGTLGDQEIAPLLLERLKSETNKGLQMAYAAALGKLEVKEAASEILSLLKTTENEGARLSLALALVRIVGDEGHFIRLLRHVRADRGTALSQGVTALRRKIARGHHDQLELGQTLNACAEAFARDDLVHGVKSLSPLIDHLPLDKFEPACALILRECSAGLGEFDLARLEYVLLALYVIEASWPR